MNLNEWIKNKVKSENSCLGFSIRYNAHYINLYLEPPKNFYAFKKYFDSKLSTKEVNLGITIKVEQKEFHKFILGGVKLITKDAFGTFKRSRMQLTLWTSPNFVSIRP
jgi:hypothetical protein